MKELLSEMIGYASDIKYDWQDGDANNEQTRAKSDIKTLCKFEIIVLYGGYYKLHPKVNLNVLTLKKY